MAKLHFELVSPEKLVFSGEVDQVDVPGSEGDFGVLAHHASMVTTLRPGIMTVHDGGSKQGFVVFGGFAEVSPRGLTVLADAAVAIDDVDMAALAAQIAELEASVSTMESAGKTDMGAVIDREITRLDHFRSVQQLLGSNAAH